MEANSNDEKIYNQMRESYGKLVYSYTTHLKDARLIQKKNNVLKVLNIVFSAVSTCGLIAVIIDWNTRLCGIITAVLTTSLLVLSTYLKSASLDEKITSHRNTANALWILREKYISYLSDFENMNHDEKIKKRDKYITELSNIYANQLITSEKAYALSQDALKNKEEQFFSDEEIDVMLPSLLRNKK